MQPRSRTRFLNTLFLLTTVLALSVAIFAVVFSSYEAMHADARQHANRETIQSWTCKWGHGLQSFNKDVAALRLPNLNLLSSPAGFGRLCTESEASYWMMVGLTAAEAVAVAVATMGAVIDLKIAKCRRARQDEKWAFDHAQGRTWI